MGNWKHYNLSSQVNNDCTLVLILQEGSSDDAINWDEIRASNIFPGNVSGQSQLALHSAAKCSANSNWPNTFPENIPGKIPGKIFEASTFACHIPRLFTCPLSLIWTICTFDISITSLKNKNKTKSNNKLISLFLLNLTKNQKAKWAKIARKYSKV